jgi:NDP-sugar pyrophosphorylase family protein
MLGVILAAGRGERMGWIGRRYPKALLPVGNRTLVAHHLELLASLGARRAIVVTGHLERDVRRELEQTPLPIAVKTLLQRDPCGIGAALELALPLLDEPFAVLLADCYVQLNDTAVLARRLRAAESTVVVVRDRDTTRLRAGCVVEMDALGTIAALAEKPDVPRTTLRACGIYALTPDIADAIASNPRSDIRNEYELTTALDRYCRQGRRLFVDAIAEWDCNITRPADLLACNLRLLGNGTVIADGARVAADAELQRVAVASTARVDRGVRLRDCVVFPAARASASAQSALITPAGTVRVRGPGDPVGRPDRRPLAPSATGGG